MNSPILLSRHSSNPLEVPTSDQLNRQYRAEYLAAQQMRGSDLSSDDPICGYRMSDRLEEYQRHVAQLLGKNEVPQLPPGFEIVEPTDSDDELDIVYENDEEQQEMLEKSHDRNDGELGEYQLEQFEDHEQEGDVPDTEMLDEEAVNDDVELENALTDEADEVIDDDEDEDEDEELSFLLRPEEEQQEILEEIVDLQEAVPQLKEDYKLIDRLGTGTFSSVYKAFDLGYHEKWDNSTWLGNHPETSSAHYQSAPRPSHSKVTVAVKRIYVTSNPERIRNEISILKDCLGCRHVSQLITAFRYRDQVVVVMPYHRNEDFREYCKTLSMDGMKSYFRCMLRALRDVHARGIIHRDVKPANFLYDPRTNTGTLCDFGLASRIDSHPNHNRCLHTPPSREHPHGRVKPSKQYDVREVVDMQKLARHTSNLPSDKVGYLDKDIRPVAKANRAGTRGFRAPEVLFKCAEQSGAIDVWSAGITLLFFLVKKFPLFHSNDDVEALLEIAVIIGKRRIEKAATLHARTFACNIPSLTADGMTWQEFIEKQNTDLFRIPPYIDENNQAEVNAYFEDLTAALDLVDKMLHPESTKRITAREALYHRWLAEEGKPGDDEFFPHPFGEGVCGELHFTDEVTEELCVSALGPQGTGVKRLDAGEGIAIGSRPCEHHRHIVFDIGSAKNSTNGLS